MEFNVSPAKALKLKNDFARLNISEKDIEEIYSRASGNGGQKINKTSVKVTITHKPTGIQISSAETRSQNLNRYYARKLLAEKIDFIVNGVNSKKSEKNERLRKQKSNRRKKSEKKYGQRADEQM